MIQKEISFNNPLMKYISKTHPVKNNPMGLPTQILIDDKLNNIITSIDRHHTRMNLIKSLTSIVHSFSEDDAAFMSDCYCELIYKQYKEELFKII